MKTHQKLACEFIGTFTLIFAGVGAICSGVGILGIALAHGLALVVMISALGHISGAHFNPAVTIGALLSKKIPAFDALLYMLAQLLGAYVGALAVKAIFAADVVAAANLGTPMLAANVGINTGILLELIMTFFLMTVIFGTAIDARAPKCGGLFIGLTVTMDILAGGAISGAAMNPARAFGPAMAAGVWSNHWVYWVGPIAGAVIASFVYTCVLAKED